VLLQAAPAQAEVKVIEASGVHPRGDNDSRNDARRSMQKRVGQVLTDCDRGELEGPRRRR
jgi:hypothetical protein